MTSSQDEEFLNNFISALQKHPEYREQILGILKPGDYVRRDELNETLNEIKQLRKDFNQRFEEQQQNFNERFEANEQAIQQLRKDFNQRFEEQQQNFNERFEANEQAIQQLRKDFNQRFEEQQQNFNQRFEEQQQNFNERFEANEQAIQQLIREMREGFSSIRGEMAEFSTKYGYQREAEARKLLKEFLKSEGIPTSKIKHHQIIDEKGIVFGKDFITEIDAYYEKEDGIWAFEIKAKVDDRDVFHFHKVVELFEKAYNKEIGRKIITCFEITEKAEEDSKRFDIEIWRNKKEDPILLRPSDMD